MSEGSSFDNLFDLEPEVISRSESLEPEVDPRVQEFLAKIETLTSDNNQMKVMNQMEALRIQLQMCSEVKFKTLLEEESEKSQGFLNENHHLKEESQSMYTYCDVLDGELSKLKAEPISANVLPLEESCAIQKQTFPKSEQKLEMASNAQKSCSEEVKNVFRWLEALVPRYLKDFNEKVKQLSVQEQKETLMEQSQTSNSLASIFNGEWEYVTSQCTGTMEQKNFERQFEHSTMVYELTDTHLIVKTKRNGICTLEKTFRLNEAVVSDDQTATTTIVYGIGILTDIRPNSEYPQGCQVVRMIVDEMLGIGVSSGDGMALLVFTKV